MVYWSNPLALELYWSNPLALCREMSPGVAPNVETKFIKYEMQNFNLLLLPLWLLIQLGRIFRLV